MRIGGSRGPQAGGMANLENVSFGNRDFADLIGQMTQGGKSESAYYLEMQREMQAESRFFNTVSNILKNRHDSAMTAIRNIR